MNKISIFEQIFDFVATILCLRHGVLYFKLLLKVFFYFALACPCFEIRRKHPINIIFLALMTLSMGIMVAIIALYYETEAVLLAASTTCAIVAFITFLTAFSQFDITE